MNCCEKNEEEDFKLENESQSDLELIKLFVTNLSVSSMSLDF